MQHEHDVPRFDRMLFDAGHRITRIGGGSLGGKAANLCVVQDTILGGFDGSAFEGLDVAVPRMTVIGTDVFDAFMAHNALYPLALSEEADERIAHAFQRAELPAVVLGDLRALASHATTPLAVRSSSLLEDTLEHPFAGVYGTKMIPNNQADPDARFRKLVEAIKFVYASTFFVAARSYARSAGQDIRGEKMAVIVQDIAGSRRGDRFYPVVSGVARSYNYYPTGRARADQGVITLALGLGKTIVDGGLSWSYCPAYPKKPPPFGGVRDLLRNTQTRFWAVHMGRPPIPDPTRETEYMRQLGLAEAEYDDTVRYVASTYSATADRLVPGVGVDGPRALDFSPVLTFRDPPLNDLVRELMARSEVVLEAPVEIEFAVDLSPPRGLPARFAFLQVRPMTVCDETVQLSASDLESPDVLVASDRCLGNGMRSDITDVVYLPPETFDASHTMAVAEEIERINETIGRTGRPYLLMGFGRWGSSDPWLGVPVEWGAISGARVIVEASLPQMHPDLSQGSHFFQNLTAFQVMYLSLPHGGPHDVDWAWLERQERIHDGPFVRHVRLASPLDVRVDGRTGRGVIQRRD